MSFVLWFDSIAQAAETHQADVDFTGHIVEFEQRGKTRAAGPLSHLIVETGDHFLSKRRPEPDVESLASYGYLQSFFSSQSTKKKYIKKKKS